MIVLEALLNRIATTSTGYGIILVWRGHWWRGVRTDRVHDRRTASRASENAHTAYIILSAVRRYHTAMPTDCNAKLPHGIAPDFDLAQAERIHLVEGFVGDEVVKAHSAILPDWISGQKTTPGGAVRTARIHQQVGFVVLVLRGKPEAIALGHDARHSKGLAKGAVLVNRGSGSVGGLNECRDVAVADRKSTRLNSSHIPLS